MDRRRSHSRFFGSGMCLPEKWCQGNMENLWQCIQAGWGLPHVTHFCHPKMGYPVVSRGRQVSTEEDPNHQAQGPHPCHNCVAVPSCLLFAEGPETVRHPNFRQPDFGEMNPAMVMKLLSCQPCCYFGMKPSDFWDFYALGSNRIKGFMVRLNNPHHSLCFIPFPSVFFASQWQPFPKCFQWGSTLMLNLISLLQAHWYSRSDFRATLLRRARLKQADTSPRVVSAADHLGTGFAFWHVRPNAAALLPHVSAVSQQSWDKLKKKNAEGTIVKSFGLCSWVVLSYGGGPGCPFFVPPGRIWTFSKERSISQWCCKVICMVVGVN